MLHKVPESQHVYELRTCVYIIMYTLNMYKQIQRDVLDVSANQLVSAEVSARAWLWAMLASCSLDFSLSLQLSLTVSLSLKPGFPLSLYR